MCVPAPDGKYEDVVVSSDRLEALGMKLSTVEQMVLEAAETELAESRIIAFTSTFALLRSPVKLVVGGKHHKVDLYYAFCVDPTTGRLRVGVWSMWPGTVKQPPPPSVIELAAEDEVRLCRSMSRPSGCWASLPSPGRSRSRSCRPARRSRSRGKAAVREDRGDRQAPHRREYGGVRADARTILFAAPEPANTAKTAKASGAGPGSRRTRPCAGNPGRGSP